MTKSERGARQTEIQNLIVNSSGIYETTIQNLTQTNKSTLNKTLKRYADNGIFKKEKVSRNIFFQKKYNIDNVLKFENQSKVCDFLAEMELKTENVFIEEKGKNVLLNMFYDTEKIRANYANTLKEEANKYLNQNNVSELQKIIESKLLKINVRLTDIDNFSLVDYSNVDTNYLDILTVNDNTLIAQLRDKIASNNKEQTIKKDSMIYSVESNLLGYFDKDLNFIAVENILDFTMFLIATCKTTYFVSAKESDYKIADTLYVKSAKNKRKYTNHFNKKGGKRP